MSAKPTLSLLAITLSLIAIVPNSLLMASEPSQPLTGQLGSTPVVRDISLSDNSSLNGQIMDSNAQPAAGVPAVLVYQNKEIARIVTDDDGRFTIDGVRSGTYQLISDQQVTVFRAWTAGTAPPSAVSAIQVSGGPVVRGQFGGIIGGFSWPSHAAGMLHNPCALGLIIGGAVATPFILHDNESLGS